MKRRQTAPPDQLDLFEVGAGRVGHRVRLATLEWPEPSRLPVNHQNARVHDQVWGDLTTASRPLAIAGYASVENLIALVARLEDANEGNTLRVLLGSEPSVTDRPRLGSATAVFTDEVKEFWSDRGISLALSAKLVQTLEASKAGRVQVRYVAGSTRMHAKIYVGDRAVTLGSSNFTNPGMRGQFEANVRFEADVEPQRYLEVASAAGNYWDIGEPWDAEFRDLLDGLLRFVPWREALARACADLLDGQWAERYLQSSELITGLWPSQVAGIAEALWIVESVGSVLVADATGSGKTRMGAHLARAVRDRLLSTGRVRSGLTVLVGPPAVLEQWKREATGCELSLDTVSHGVLSQDTRDGSDRLEAEQVAKAQILAIDEAHNFLSSASNRTAKVRQSSADNVLMFTATPINRGTQDLLALVDLLGADNFSDEALRVLDGLARRGSDTALSEEERSRLRDEIQRFTVRRTKSQLNALVDREPELYRHPSTGRPSRYPTHAPRTYSTGDSEADERLALTIRSLVAQLRGMTLLGDVLAVPPALRHEYTDDRWLDLRLGAARGLAAHNVLSSMRSSKAALLEHLIGTEEALAAVGLPLSSKQQRSGNVLGRVATTREAGVPKNELSCELPPWLTEGTEWVAACVEEEEVYRGILDAALQLSTRREQAKADKLRGLTKRKHGRVLAFDRHPITLAVIEAHLAGTDVPIVIATGGNAKGRRNLLERFERNSTQRGIGLCSDAMNEGINLQGASAVVQLDMPTTLRVAEQRVGRVDRMDSIHPSIEVWWPKDSPAFTTRANELLVARSAESSALLGSNLQLPDFIDESEKTVDPLEFAREADGSGGAAWDGIHDALDPVRRLVEGPEALLTPADYELHRTTTHRVLSRVSPLRTDSAWAFLAVAGTKHGAPHWMLIERGANPLVDLVAVASRLRELLAPDPPDGSFDDNAAIQLEEFLRRARSAEVSLLPRRAQRALAQMRKTSEAWGRQAGRRGDFDLAERWQAIGRLAAGEIDAEQPELTVDLYQVADAWIRLIRPLREEYRRSHRRQRYITLSHIDATLRTRELEIGAVEAAMSRLEYVEPLDRRISACILGVPTAR